VPGLISAGTFSFTLSWNEFIYAPAFIQSGEKKTVPVAILTELASGDVYSVGVMTGARLGSLPAAISYSFFVDYYVSSLTGAVKDYWNIHQAAGVGGPGGWGTGGDASSGPGTPGTGISGGMGSTLPGTGGAGGTSRGGGGLLARIIRTLLWLLPRLLTGVLALPLLLFALDLFALLAITVRLLRRIALVGVVHGVASMFAAAARVVPLWRKRLLSKRGCALSPF